MQTTEHDLDLMPPAFADGLDDWSQTDGTPDTPTYDELDTVRIPRGDPDFGTCLEILKTRTVQRLRYMGEVPYRAGRFLEISARLKGLRGPLPMAQIAAWPGAAGGNAVPDLATTGSLESLVVHDAVVALRAVIGPEARPGVDLVWDTRALYAHVGLDLIGPSRGVVRIEDISVRDVTRAFAAAPVLPGFTAAPLR